MTTLHQQLIRALIAAQVAVLEHADEDTGLRDPPLAIDALDECLKRASKLAKQLRKEI